MQDILINGCYKAKGEMTIKQYKEGTNILIEGILELNQYFIIIDSIQTDSLLVTDIDVKSEIFGTKDNKIVYGFTAKNLNISKDILNQELLKKGDEINE